METIKYWRRYRFKLQGYAAVIEAQRVCYLDTLEGLFSDIIESEEEINVLMSNPGGPAWQNPVHDARLRQRLDRSYKVFLGLLEELNKNLLTMCHELGINQHGEVLWADYSIVDREMKRLKVTFFKDANQSLVVKIEKANKDLRELTRQNIYIEPKRKSRRSKKVAAELGLIRRHATSLYQIFIAGKAWKCRCRDLHCASLRLESRSQASATIAQECEPKLKFRILLATTQPSVSSPIALKWQEIEVRPTLEQPEPVARSKTARSGKRVSLLYRSQRLLHRLSHLEEIPQ